MRTFIKLGFVLLPKYSETITFLILLCLMISSLIGLIPSSKAESEKICRVCENNYIDEKVNNKISKCFFIIK